MKCRVCGYDLDPNRAYCDMCGTKVNVPQTSRDMESRPFEGTFQTAPRPTESFARQDERCPKSEEPARQENEFSWNVYNFPKPKQPRDIPIQWPQFDHPTPKSDPEDPSEGTIREAMEKKQPVVMVNSDVSEGFIAVPEKADTAAPEKADNLWSKNPAGAWSEPMAESTKQAEKFFTFQKKNEEFQRLLDQEYEKLKHRKKGESYREEEFPMHREEDSPGHREPLQMTLQARQPLAGGTFPFQTPAAPVVRAGDLSDFERMLMENTRDADLMTGDTLPINVQKIQEEVRAQEEARIGKKSANQERIEAMARARQEYFRSIGIEPDEEELDKTKIIEPVPRPEAAAPEEIQPETIEDLPEPEEIQPEMIEDLPKPEEIQPEELPEPMEETPEPMEEVSAPEEVPVSVSSKSKEREAAEKYVDELFAPLDEAIVPKKKRKKHKFLRFLLVLLLLAGLAEGTVIGMRQVLPDHEVTKALTRIEQAVRSEAITRSIQIREFLDKTLKDLGFGPSEPEAEADPEPAPDPEPVFDLGEVVRVYNKNIQSVTESPKLGFVSANTYKIEGLGDMDVITDIPTKEAVYACLVSYNSKWIDYVNTGEDRSCLDLLKTDGAAYRSAINFSKVGKIRETFDSLALGEIRSDGSQYYVFAREQITVAEDGAEAERSYSWIYRLEDVAGDIKIIDYTSFE